MMYLILLIKKTFNIFLIYLLCVTIRLLHSLDIGVGNFLWTITSLVDYNFLTHTSLKRILF